jgi:hypothetical protein
MADPLEGLWKKVLDDWDDEAAHGAFIEHCRSTKQLQEAAVRYRGMAGDHARGAVAERRLRGLTVVALSTLETTRTTAPTARYATLARIAVILLFLAGSIALLFAFRR